MSPSATPGRCRACGSDRLAPHLRVAAAGARDLRPATDAFGSALADLVRCESCGHAQLAAFPSDGELAAAYAAAQEDAYVEEEAGQRATARRLLELLERHSSPGRLLDAGCWVGFLLDEARRRGWEPAGLEPSAWASAYARDRLGLEVETVDLAGADLPEAAFAAVVLADVIEHLPRPGEALDLIARALRPGGVLLLVLPDAGSRVARALGRRWWSVIPTHVQYFTRASLATLLHRHGYEVLDVRTAPKAFSVRYYAGRVMGYSPVLGRALVRAAERAGVADRLWAPDFGDRMAVLARAPGG